MSVVIDSVTGKAKSQTEIWDLISGNRGRHFRRNFNKSFHRSFPNGHRDSLHKLVVSLSKEEDSRKLKRRGFFSDLFRLHPEAVSLLLEYAQDYKPYVWNDIPPEPRAGWCYENSLYMMDSSYDDLDESKRFVYVEGVTMGATVRPMIHAWNSYGDRRYGQNIAIDWTLFAVAKWNRYFGIPLTRDEYNGAMSYLDKDCCASLILTKKNFPLVKDYLIEVLKKRKDEQK